MSQEPTVKKETRGRPRKNNPPTIIPSDVKRLLEEGNVEAAKEALEKINTFKTVKKKKTTKKTTAKKKTTKPKTTRKPKVQEEPQSAPQQNVAQARPGFSKDAITGKAINNIVSPGQYTGKSDGYKSVCYPVPWTAPRGENKFKDSTALASRDRGLRYPERSDRRPPAELVDIQCDCGRWEKIYPSMAEAHSGTSFLCDACHKSRQVK